MKKKRKKPAPVAIKAKVEPRSYASVYARALARQVAAEMTPARTPRKAKTAR
jgi:hypothetical protein